MEKITTKEMAKSIHSTHSYFPQEGTLPLLKGNESKEKDKGNAVTGDPESEAKIMSKFLRVPRAQITA